MIGGLETIGEQLAEEWTKRGHAVRVWTQAPLGNASEHPTLDVVRRPRLLGASRLVAWSDVVVYSGITLRDLPVALGRRPLVFIHHGMLEYREGFSKRLVDLKRVVSRMGTNIAVSHAVARSVPGHAHAIPNAFRPALEGVAESASPDSLLVIGRLVSEKGVDVAIRALAVLHSWGHMLPLIVVGDGPERSHLQALAEEIGVSEAVTFRGWMQPEHLGEALARARLVVIPSRYESFGIVALEAIAAGVPVVASNVGGLPEAVSLCGSLVAVDDPTALAGGILNALTPERQADFKSAAPAHLDAHRIEHIAGAYLDVFERAAGMA